MPIAKGFRRLHASTTFVGITGSCGKTTTKFLIREVLASRYAGIASLRGRNRAGGMLQAMLKVRRRHRFCVVELGAFGPGTLDQLLWTLEPQGGVVTNVGWDHLSAFGDPDEVAREKVKLIRALPSRGWAALNGDDPRVRQMASQSSAPVLFYGVDPTNHVIAEEISSRWPDRLSFRVRYREDSLNVRTRLCGEHWVYSVLAALCAGIHMGVPLKECVEAVARSAPASRRMEPFRLDDRITWIRDDWKASSWTVAPALKFLSDAQARRRIFVLGQVSDDRTKPNRLYPRLAREARKFADQVILFGRWASHGLKARAHDDDRSVLAFPSALEAAQFLEKTLESGDLLYVKASGRRDPSIDAAFSGEFWKRARAL